LCFFFFSSRRRHTRWPRDWSSDVCSSDLHGRNGEDVVLRVPVGTQVLDEEKETVTADLNREGQRIRLLKGGNGGFGNAYFKSSRSEERRVGKECRSRCVAEH